MGRRLARLRSLSGAQWRAVLASAALVPLVGLSLRLRGFRRTAAALAARSERAPVAASAGEARATADAVALVAGRSLVGARCLVRSLVLWYLLRRDGVDAELVIGAAPPQDGQLPAHAWVEVAGEPVNDTHDVRERYGSFDLRLPRLADTARP